MADHLRHWRAGSNVEGEVGVAIIYLKYNEPEQTLGNLLGSLLKQLVQEQKSVPKLLQELYSRHRDQHTSPLIAEVQEALLSLIETYGKVFFVVDALDECSEEIRWGLVEKLRELPNKVQIMITSRVLDNIEEELEDFERLDIKANRADIDLFIDNQISKNVHLRRVVGKSPALRDDIKQAVGKIAEDMCLVLTQHSV